MVTVIPLSDVVDSNVYFFKLDVQGFEYDVLKGARTLFERRSVKTLLMEVVRNIVLVLEIAISFKPHLSRSGN